MSDPDLNIFDVPFGPKISAWDTDRLHVKQLLSMVPQSELLGNGKLTMSSDELIVFKGGPVCITQSLLCDTIVGKKMANNILLAGIQIVDSKLPTSALENPPLIIKGCWDANLNVPPLTSSVGENGDYYLVCVAGNTDLNGYNSWAVGDAAIFNGADNSWYRLGIVSATIESAGGSVSLVKFDQGPAMVIKGLTPGTGMSLSSNSSAVTISNTSPATSVTLTSSGGSDTLVNTGIGPALSIKGLTAGTGVGLSSGPGSVTISNNDPTLSLSSSGGSQTLVSNGIGPAFIVKGLTPGAGMGLSSTSSAITINNTSPASSASLSSTGVSQTLVNSGTPPGFLIKGLTAGSGILLSPTSTDLTITNTSSAAAVTLANAGTTSLVNTGVGPALAMKGLVAGTGIGLVSSATNVTITATNATVTLSSAGGSNSLVNNGTGPSLAVKGLTAGSNISMTASSTDITIADTGAPITLSNAGGSNSLVNNGTGPSLALKGLTAGTSIGLAGTSTNVTLTNNSPGTLVALTNAGSGNSIVASGSGPSMSLKGLAGGTGISLSSTSANVTINSTISPGFIVYFCGQATPNVSLSPFGFYNPNNTTINSTTIAAGSNGAVLPQATINVVDTTGFPTSGTLQIGSTLGVYYVAYTGKTTTSFTGCTGGAGVLMTGQIVTQTTMTSGGVTPGGSSTLSIYGTWYDPMTMWNPVSHYVSISSTTGYLSAWDVPVGSYSNVMPPTNTGSFAAWARCNGMFGSLASFGGGGTGTRGNIFTSSGVTAINVPVSGSGSISTLTTIALDIYSDNGSGTNVDVNLHLFSDNNFRINGSSWTIYKL